MAIPIHSFMFIGIMNCQHYLKLILQDHEVVGSIPSCYRNFSNFSFFWFHFLIWDLLLSSIIKNINKNAFCICRPLFMLNYAQEKSNSASCNFCFVYLFKTLCMVFNKKIHCCQKNNYFHHNKPKYVFLH